LKDSAGVYTYKIRHNITRIDDGGKPEQYAFPNTELPKLELDKNFAVNFNGYKRTLTWNLMGWIGNLALQ